MKREVKVIAISYSQSQIGSYVVVLSEVNGFRKLPIVVKTHDAQVIALKIENVDPPRPTPHDMVYQLSQTFHLDCQEVYIHKVFEGIFYSKASFTNGIDDVDVEISSGDAIITSLGFNCPLYISEEVLASCGIMSNDEGELTPTPPTEPKVSIEDLNQMMMDAIDNEDYETAAKLRDRIKELDNEKK
jgi:bifunctional DNase/RNase